MIETVKNAWKIPELRKKLTFVLFAIIIFRLGFAIYVPFVDTKLLADQFAALNSGNLLGYFNTLAGGGMSTASIFAMSIYPYINASIIIQLLQVAIPALERLAKEGGEEGKKKIQKIVRITTLVLACIMKAVDTHADLLRCSASCVGNEHRLGAQEAPPAIISIFLGDQLDGVVNQIVSNADSIKLLTASKLDSGVSTVPVIKKDATDRNRTSPFAFTGNKFEFRMVGSSDSIADANVTLNAIVAEAFCEAADILEKSEDFQSACTKLIHDWMTEHQRIVFNGNGYSEEWVEEAARRGLPNLPSMVNAVPSLTTPKAEALFTKFGIYTKSELESRAEIMYETYAKVLKIEAQTMIHMAGKHYIPAAIHYNTRLGQSIASVSTACAEADLSVQKSLLVRCSALLAEADKALEELKVLLPQVDSMDDVEAMAHAYHDQIVPAMAALRKPVDELELLVDKDIWPVPTYGDLMFEV